MERLGRERVVLLLAESVGGLVDREVDPERVELRAVRIETSGEGVLGHVRVALDVAPDLGGRHGPPLRHQVRDQRQLTDELLGVLGQGFDTIERRAIPAAGFAESTRSLRNFGTGGRSVSADRPIS